MRLVFVLASLILSVPCAYAKTFESTAQATAGKWNKIGQHASWDDRCSFTRFPSIINAKSTNGEVRSENGVKITLKGNIQAGSPPKCKGVVIDGVAVEYRPKSGFKGRDTVTYSVKYGPNSKNVQNKITVNVR